MATPSQTNQSFASILGADDAQDDDTYEADPNIDELPDADDAGQPEGTDEAGTDEGNEPDEPEQQQDGDPQPVEDNFPERNLPDKTAQQILKQYNTSLIPMFKRKIAKLEQEVSQGSALSQQAREFQTQTQQFGLTPQEANVGLQMAATYKTNPALFIQRIIADAQSKGVQLPQGTPNMGVDASSIANLIRQELDSRGLAVKQPQQVEQDPQTLVDNFFTQHPEAILHERELALIARQHPQDSLDQVYGRLRQYVAQQGFDINRPLKQQFEARQQNGNSNPQQQRPQNFTTRRNTAPAANGSVNRDEEMADPNLSYKEITRMVRQNLGI